MLWAIFSILTALAWATSNVIDKYILSKWTKNPLIPAMTLGIMSLAASAAIYLVRGFAPMSAENLLLSFVAALGFVFAIVFYFNAVKIEEISRVGALIYLDVIFILAGAAIFLGESLTQLNYLGVFLLVAGAILISIRSLADLRLRKSFWLMMLSAISITINATITKYLLQFADFWTVFAYTRGLWAFIAMLPIFYFHFHELAALARERGKKAIAVMSANESLTLIGTLLITIATSLGPVTLVNAMTSVQPFIVLGFTLALSAFYPKILKEETGKSTVLMKLAAIILMFAGVILIT